MKLTKGIRVYGVPGLVVIPFFFLLIFTSYLFASEKPSYVWVRSVTEKLSAPTAVAVDSDENLYVVESSSNALYIYSREGRYTKRLTGLSKPLSVAVDERGRVFVGNAGRGNVEVYGGDLKLLFKLGAGDGEFLLPGAIAIDSTGSIFVADGKDNKIKVYTAEGAYRSSLGEDGTLHFPTSIAINKISGELIITDLPVVQTKEGPIEGARIQIFDAEGGLRRSFGDSGQGEGKLTKPMGVAADTSGKIYVTDSYQNVVQIFDSNGKSLGSLFDPQNPYRTPLGIAISDRDIAFIASLNAGKVEVYYLSYKKASAMRGGKNR